MDSKNLWNCRSISAKSVLIFPNNFLDLGSDMIEKQGIKSLRWCSCKCHTSVLLIKNSEATIHGEGKMQHFFCFSVVFDLNTTLHNPIRSSSQFALDISECFPSMSAALNFFGTSSRSSCVINLSLMSSRLWFFFR